MWRTVPMHRSEVEGTFAEDGPPDLPDHVRLEEVLHPPGGAGPLFHRRYRGRIREADMGARELIDTISADLDLVAPREFASFTKVQGEKGGMTVGDEYVVRMPGPWDGPIRVIEKHAAVVPLRHARGPPRGGADPLRGVRRPSCSSSPSSRGPAPATGSPTSCSTSCG